LKGRDTKKAQGGVILLEKYKREGGRVEEGWPLNNV
jgi:hypothetical protein